MKHCKQCGVTVRGTAVRCPLCQKPLEGPPTQDAYPAIPTLQKQFGLFFRLLTFGAVCAAVICVAVNLLVPAEIFWAAFALLGIVCLWLTVTLGIKKRHKIASNITWQVVLVSLLSIVWDMVTGWHGWSIDYVVPIVCGAAMLAVFLLTRILRLSAGDSLFCLLLDILFCLVPLLFYLTGTLGVILPSILCVALSIISLTALLVFEGRSIRAELSRRFHL